MLKNIKKYVYKKLLSYHLKKSDHYYIIFYLLHETQQK